MDMLNAQPPHRAEPFDRLLIKVAGVDEETLRLCQHHWDNVRAVGEIMICTWLYQAALFSVISHRLFAASGQIRPELVMVSMFIATFIMAIELIYGHAFGLAPFGHRISQAWWFGYFWRPCRPS